jgi:hypothetical protein
MWSTVVIFVLTFAILGLLLGFSDMLSSASDTVLQEGNIESSSSDNATAAPSEPEVSPDSDQGS